MSGVFSLWMSLEMDKADRKILDLLQTDASLSLNDISERVGLSPTPCWKRIRKLEDAGVILRRVAIVDPAKVGAGVTVFVSLKTREHSREWLETFAETVSAFPEVVEFYRMSGDVDYMLRVLVADIAAYDAFYKKLVGAVPLVEVTSRFAMEAIKQTTQVPLA